MAREERSRGRDRDEPRGRDRDEPRGRSRDDDRGSDRGRGGGRERDDRRGPKGGGSARRGGYRSEANVRKRTEQTAGNFDTIFKSGVEQWYPKPGENAVRILPASWPDAEHYGYDVFVHSYIGSSGSSYICPKKTSGKTCAACDESAELKAAGEEEASKSMAAKKKSVVYVLDRDERKPTARVWVMSWNQDKEIADNSIIKRTNTTLFIDDPETGWDLIIKRTGKGLNTRYSYMVDRDPSPIDEDPRTQDDILDYIDENPIPDLLKFADNDVIEKALDGGTRPKDRELDDEDDKRGRGRDRGGRDEDDRSPPRRGRGRDEPDDEPRGRDRGRDGGDEEDTRSSRGDRLSGRNRDEDDRPSRRGRDELDGEEDRPARRGRDEEREERPRGRDREEERGGGRDEERGGRDRDEERPRSRREPSDEPEADERPSRRGRDEGSDERPRRR